MPKRRNWQDRGRENAETAAALAGAVFADPSRPAPPPALRRSAGFTTVAEEIAAVIADVRAGRVEQHLADRGLAGVLYERVLQQQPVVDATAIYLSMVERATGPGIKLYDDFPSVMSPWTDATIAYVNQHRNVLMLQVHCEAWDPKWRWDTDNPIDWDRVRWMVEAAVWVGGCEGTGERAPTGGPVRLLQHAVYEDGSAGDMRWISLVRRRNDDPSLWEMPTAVLNATLNFLACRNIEIAVPNRPFPVRLRLRKTRVQVQTIVVRPAGKRRASGGGQTVRPVDALDSPLTSVRGRFNHYGPEYGAGLMFGKLSGKFWIPAHVRGAGDGFEQKDYVLRPGKDNPNS